MNIREKFDAFIQKFGHEVLYVRRDIRFRCDCYVERSGEPKSSCERCMGSGYDVKVERIKARRTIMAVPESLVGLNLHTSRGTHTPKAYVYYISESVKPKDGDYLLEVEWSQNNMPKRILQKHFISVAEPKQGSDGRNEFYQVYCKYQEKSGVDDTALSNNPI